ncbi:MAG TPA: hypothetical protein VIE88_09865, partial [Vicinamibacteria bacterium]
VQTVLERMKEAPIDVFVVWIPAIRGDDYAAANRSLSKIVDERARHYWDGGQELGDAFSPVLGIRSRMAWDVYLLFDANADWKDSPPVPAEWLHQLAGEDPARNLSEERLEEAIAKLAH